jgi:hypothetical protein
MLVNTQKTKGKPRAIIAPSEDLMMMLPQAL